MNDATAPAPPTAPSTSCHACAVRCDRVVYPGACVQKGCPNLYAYDLPDGRRFVGCLQRVFAPEIDLALLEAATPAGFGALRCTRVPLEICRTAIDQAFRHRSDALGCRNPEFFEPLGRGSFRVSVRPG